MGAGTKLTFWTWYFTEGNDQDSPQQYDNKLINILVDGTPQAFAQVVSIAPPSVFEPGSVFQNPGVSGAPSNLVFIPVALDDASGNPQLVNVSLPLTDFVGKDIAVQFAFNSVDEVFNNDDGWFVDDIAVEGAGKGDVQIVTVAQFASGVAFPIGDGTNTIKVQATRNA